MVFFRPKRCESFLNLGHGELKAHVDCRGKILPNVQQGQDLNDDDSAYTANSDSNADVFDCAAVVKAKKFSAAKMGLLGANERGAEDKAAAAVEPQLFVLRDAQREIDKNPAMLLPILPDLRCKYWASPKPELRLYNSSSVRELVVAMHIRRGDIVPKSTYAKVGVS